MWYDSREMLPMDEEWKLVYSCEYGKYYFAKYNAYEGWYEELSEPVFAHGQSKNYFRNISHWLDQELNFPFPIGRKPTPIEMDLFLQRPTEKQTEKPLKKKKKPI